MKNKLTIQNQPESLNMRPIKQLSDEQWIAVGQAVYTLIDTNLGNRQGLEDSLNYGNALYEQLGQRANPPWPGCANIIVPVVFTAVSEMTSRLAGSTLLPRPYSVHGTDPISTQYSHTVEQFYNSEYENNDWKTPQRTCIQLAARDGTSILEVLWEKKVSESIQLIDGPVIGEDGQPQLDQFGRAIVKKQRQVVQKVEWDAVRYNAVELRDFVLFPNYAPSIETADGVARKVYMSEQDMWAMVEAGTFKKEAVEKILAFVNSGQSEQPYDRQGNFTYTIGGRISIGDYAISIPDEGVKIARGPVEMWRVHTRQFDFDGDNFFEENIIWIHDTSQIMAGYCPFEYEGGRPFFSLCVMPRPNRFYGFSVPDVVGAVQEEASAQRNARLDWLDISANPTQYATNGYKNRGENEQRRYGPGILVEVDTPTDFGFIQLGEVPDSLFKEEASLLAMADRSIGAPQTQAIPQPGAGSNQKGRAAQQAMALQGMQTNDMIVSIRTWMQKALKYTHLLYVKYGKDQMQMLQASSQGNIEVTVPREILAQNYVLGINGQGGPLDKDNRRQDAMAVYEMGLQNPLVAGNMEHVYNVTRNFYETFDYPDVTGFIGTMDEARQLGEAKKLQQQKMQQEQMAAHIIKQTDIGPAGVQPDDKSED